MSRRSPPLSLTAAAAPPAIASPSLPPAPAGAGFAAGRAPIATAARTAAGGGAAAAAAAFGAAALAAGASAAACAGGSREERSFVMVKPDGVQRGHVAEILGRFERRGFKVVAARVVVPSRELAAQHYAEHAGKPFFPRLVAFLSSGPVFAFVIEGKGAVGCGRAMLGTTDPQAAAPGTIRGDIGLDTGMNLCHASDAADSAAREIALWFRSEDMARFTRAEDRWVYEAPPAPQVA